MKKTFKKALTSFMAAACFSTGMVSISANAANTKDKYFNSFYVPPSIANTWSRLCQNYSKTNNTPVYIKITKANSSVRVQVLGVASSGATTNRTQNARGVNCTSVYCEKGKEYLINNNVYNNAPYADLQFYSVNGYSADYINGAWSSDSIRETGHTYYTAND